MEAQATSTDHGQALPAGTRIEEFVIERVLGAGGFGITYLASDTTLGRQVVIKENLPAQFAWRDPTTGTVRPRHTTGDSADDFSWSMENFAKEAAMLASLDHPGIVRVLRSFKTRGTAFFIMPFVEGTALDVQIQNRTNKNQAFSEDELKGLLWFVLDALEYLHRQNIYHRDIKPGNILITGEGAPVLIDFGSARQLLSEHSMTVVESPGYTPFEQLQSRGNIGPWSDLYALGGTLYKMVTGTAPPKANDRVIDDQLVPLVAREELAERFSEHFLSSIDRAMAPRAEDRYNAAAAWRVHAWEQTTPETQKAERAPQKSGDLSTSKRASKPAVSFNTWLKEKCREDPAYRYMNKQDIKDQFEGRSGDSPPPRGLPRDQGLISFEDWWARKIHEDYSYRFLEKSDLRSLYDADVHRH